MAIKVVFDEKDRKKTIVFKESKQTPQINFNESHKIKIKTDFEEKGNKIHVGFKEAGKPLKTNFGELYGIKDDTETMTYILVTPDGEEIPAVLVSEETIFDATANDIREGKTAATSEGVTVGTKVIPSYHTTEGYRFVRSGRNFEISLADNLCEFTKLQVLVCRYEGSIDASVYTEKIAINKGLYATNSTELIATVTVDLSAKKINLGIMNESEKTYLLRYITYKEEL